MDKVGNFLTRRHFTVSDWLAATVAVLTCLWLVLPSRVFLKPASYSLNGDLVSFTRSVPFGQVWAKWSTEIRSPDKECGVSGGPSVYQVQDTPGALEEIHYRLNPILVPCVVAGRFDISQTHTVLLFGVVPLRGSESVWRCAGNDGTPCARIL